MDITLAIIVVAVLGVVGAIILVLAAKFFEVYEDPRIGEVTGALPGANCGGCGFAGCSDYAKAIVEKGAPVNKCPVGGEKSAAAIAEVMGVEVGASVKMHAVVACQGTTANCKPVFDYHGIKTCAAAAGFYGGPNACKYGCLGFGDCAVVCPFGAIQVIDGVSVVNEEKCTGCGQCASACPKGIISLVPAGKKATVMCMNKDKGPIAMKACTTSCIGCMKCVKVCEFGAVKVENFVATIDPESAPAAASAPRAAPRSASCWISNFSAQP